MFAKQLHIKHICIITFFDFFRIVCSFEGPFNDKYLNNNFQEKSSQKVRPFFQKTFLTLHWLTQCNATESELTIQLALLFPSFHFFSLSHSTHTPSHTVFLFSNSFSSILLYFSRLFLKRNERKRANFSSGSSRFLSTCILIHFCSLSFLTFHICLCHFLLKRQIQAGYERLFVEVRGQTLVRENGVIFHSNWSQKGGIEIHLFF